MWVCQKAMDARVRGHHGTIWIVYPTYAIARVAWRKFRKLAPDGWITQYIGTDLQPQAIRFGPNVTVEFKSGVAPGTLVGEGLLAVWIDECGEVKERVWTESLRPTLIDYAAPALLTGTPKGHNWFWRMFMRGWSPEFTDTISYGLGSDQGMPSWENPWLKREEVEGLAREMSSRLYQQEIEAKFLADEGAVFRLSRVREKGLRYSTEKTVVLGVDLARREDFTVIVGMDRDCAVTYFDRFKDIDWPLQKARIAKVWEQLGKPPIVMDATGVGDPIVQDLQVQGIFIDPYMFTQRSKHQLIEGLSIACDAADLTLPDEPVLLHELEAFDAEILPSGRIRFRAPEGEHDDCVMALALARYGAARYADIGISIGKL